MNPEPNATLSRMAHKLRNDRRFMSHALALYQQQERLDFDQLARDLDVSPAMLVRLALCKCPDTNSEQFAQQVTEIADYTLTDEAQLANLLRQVDALEKLSELRTSNLGTEGEPTRYLSGLLAAARDHVESEEDEVSQTTEPEPPDVER